MVLIVESGPRRDLAQGQPRGAQQRAHDIDAQGPSRRAASCRRRTQVRGVDPSRCARSSILSQTLRAAILVADVNGDGHSELIVGRAHSYGLDWW